MESVADTTITAVAQAATAGVRSTVRTGTDSRFACSLGRSSRDASPESVASAATARNGSRIPPSS